MGIFDWLFGKNSKKKKLTSSEKYIERRRKKWKSLSQFTEEEKHDLRVYALNRCLGEIMKADGALDVSEVEIFAKFSKDEMQKMSQTYDVSSKLGKFVFGDKYISTSTNRTHLISVIKTFTNSELEKFFEKLITMSIADRDFDSNESEYLIRLYADVYDIDDQEIAGKNAIVNMIQDHMKKLQLIKPTKEDVVKQYTKQDDRPASIDTEFEDVKMLKRDMSGLLAYFKEMPNMERIYNEFTHAIRNGYSVEQYLNEANLMDDKEIKSIAGKGFGVISGFLQDMLKIQENAELRKDLNACIKATKILEEI